MAKKSPSKPSSESKSSAQSPSPGARTPASRPSGPSAPPENRTRELALALGAVGALIVGALYLTRRADDTSTPVPSYESESTRGPRPPTNLERGREFAERAAREPGARRLPSGVVYQEQSAGSGTSPRATDTVSVHYRGTLVDGTEFDSSRRHGSAPTSFPLDGVIPCWTQAIQLMRPGGRARLVCPADTAYGERGRPSIPPNSTLIFEVELISVGAAP